MKKTLICILFFVTIQSPIFSQTEMYNGWNSALEIINQIGEIKKRIDFKSFTLSTYNAKDDIYNLLTNRLVQRANLFKITNKLAVVQFSKVKSDRSGSSLYIEFKIKQYISGGPRDECRTNEYTYNRKLYIIPDLNLVTKKVTLKPYFDNYNMTAEACFSPGEKYVSDVRNFKNNFKRKARELENYYLNQFRVTFNLNTERNSLNFSNTNNDFKRIFWKKLNNIQNYKREDFLREVEQVRKEKVEQVRKEKKTSTPILKKPKKRTVIFVDNFNDNKNNWSKKNDIEAHGFIRDGKYYWESKSEPKTTVKEVYFDENKDYEIQGMFKIEKFEDNSYLNSLIFGANNSKRYYFGYTKSGNYRISYYDGTSYKAIKDWTVSSYLKKNDFNILTVRKINKKMLFYINDKLVHTTIEKPFYGHKFGFEASSNAQINIEYITITHLNNY